MTYKNKLDKRQMMRPRLNLDPVAVCASVDLADGNVRYLTMDDFEMDEDDCLHLKPEVYESLTMSFESIVYTNIDVPLEI
jgi:hypothetical protein